MGGGGGLCSAETGIFQMPAEDTSQAAAPGLCPPPACGEAGLLSWTSGEGSEPGPGGGGEDGATALRGHWGIQEETRGHGAGPEVRRQGRAQPPSPSLLAERVTGARGGGRQRLGPEAERSKRR